MTKVQKYFCMRELGPDIIMFIISIMISISIVCRTLSVIYKAFRIGKGNRIISNQNANWFEQLAYFLLFLVAAFIPAPAAEDNEERRAPVILIWVALIEIIRVRYNNYSTKSDNHYCREIRKSSHQIYRLFLVCFYVYLFTPLQGIMASLFATCIFFSVFELLSAIAFCKAEKSYLIGKNPKLIQNWVKRIMNQNDLRTTPMENCDYIVMGEENHEVILRSDSYNLVVPAQHEPGILKIGRVFQLNTDQDEAFTLAHPYWRDTCLSHALAKMLMRRFTKIPVLEVEKGSIKALNFVQNGLIQAGRDQNEWVFSIIQEELKFVSDLLHIKVPVYHYFLWYKVFDLIGGIIAIGNGIYLLYTICSWISSWQSFVAHKPYNHCGFEPDSWVVKTFSGLEQFITFVLILAFISIQFSHWTVVLHTKRWSNLISVDGYIYDPAKWNISYNPFANFLNNVSPNNEAIVSNTVFDVTNFTHITKWLRRNTLISFPTVVPSTDAKIAILERLSLRYNNEPRENRRSPFLTLLLESFIPPYVSYTEAILFWHIATTLVLERRDIFHRNMSNNDIFNKEVAKALSSYCHYLVSYLPEVLPDDVEFTEKEYGQLTKEILSLPRSINRFDSAIHSRHERPLVEKGVKLFHTLDIINVPKWDILAKFWVDMILWIAPANNVVGHEKILDQDELITQLWALLTHAGIYRED